MSIILLAVTLLTCLVAVLSPWMGVIAYYVLALGKPQSVWPWIFQDSRIALWVTLSTFVGVAAQLVLKKIDVRLLLKKQNVLVATLCLLVNLSHVFSPFDIVTHDNRIIDPAFTLSIFNKSILFYFIAVLLIVDLKKLKVCIYVILIITLYYTYWANNAYFDRQFWRFGDNGRLNGPPGLYIDENTFSLVFVVGMPVVYYVGLLCRNVMIKYAIWLCIPLLWHAVFLTASRGGLLALAVVSLYIGARSYSKKMSVVVVAGLFLASMWQGGAILDRVDSAMEEDASGYSDDVVADPRLISWQVGLKMLADHPLLGVGVGKFIVAFPNYSDTRSYVAHNTFLQFASNSGLAAGVIYLWFLIHSFKTRKISTTEEKHSFENVSGDLVFACMLGFYTSAVFLDLMIFEYLYFLLIILFARTHILASDRKDTAVMGK